MPSTEPVPPPADELPAAALPVADLRPAEAPAEPAPPVSRPAELSPAACAQQLKQRFPALFSGTPKPIKLRVQVDIQARAPGVFSKSVLSTFFRRYTGSTSYLQAVAHGQQRFDLDGQPQGDISDEHRQIALAELARRRTNHEAQRTAEREHGALLEQQRRNRAGLLHDHERTTLTRANFCVLKGVVEAELDGLLAMAREEAAQPRGPGARGEMRGEERGASQPRPRAPAPRGRHGR